MCRVEYGGKELYDEKSCHCLFLQIFSVLLQGASQAGSLLYF